MPLFHGNAIMALWAPALSVGASVALAGRFSASRFLADVRHFDATRFTYVGKALAYVLGTPARPDDGDNPLRHGFGTEASAPDRDIFERRFRCRLVEGYGSSEGGTAINVTPDTPPGSLGVPVPTDDVVVVDPDTLRECDRARFHPGGGLATPGTPSARSSTARGHRTSRATTRTPTATPSGSTTAGTSRATWGTATRPATSTSRDAAGTGCAWTRRTSPPPPSSGSSNATPTWPPPRSTPYPTPARGTRSWPRWNCGPGGLRPRRLRRLSHGTARPRDEVAPAPRPALGGPPPHRHRQDHQGALAGGGLAVRRAGLLEPGRGELRYRLLTDDDRRALRQEFAAHGRAPLLGPAGAPALD